VRLQIEKRPLVLVAAHTDDGQEHSIILQNAETVKLVGPARPQRTIDSKRSEDAAAAEWRAIAVTDLAAGDALLVRRSEVGRHLGTAVHETLNEV
jgi:3-dehydroquinate synthase class II